MYRTIRNKFGGVVIIALGLLSLLAFTGTPAGAAVLVTCNAGLSLGDATSDPAVPTLGPESVIVHQVINNTADADCWVELVETLYMRYIASGYKYPDIQSKVFLVPMGGGSFDITFDVPDGFDLLLSTRLSILRKFSPACPTKAETC
jgi:hypothetical protein